MLVSLNWLKELVQLPDDITPESLSEKMTGAGVAVESIHRLGEGIEKVVTGKVSNVEKHPNADKLRVCTVNVGEETELQIVCGAPNVAEGQIVPVALVGSHLPGDIKIKKGKLRGVESFGMICSANELGLDTKCLDEAQTTGIYVFEAGTPIGIDVKQALGLDDVILELELTPNRADCMNMVGVAREVAALYKTTTNLPETDVYESDEIIKGKIKVEIEAKDLCKRYVARVIKDVKIGPSPKWMQEKLRAAGIRAISNVVDITNFVMLEQGQPLHAFDYDKVAGQTIIVRTASKDETLVTLDEQERTLGTEMLVIADKEKPVALAGVMGGLETEVTAETSTILLESAYFEGVTVRQTSRKLGLRSESSSRFEKGIDRDLALTAANRAAQLFAEYAGGQVLKGYAEASVETVETVEIKLYPQKVASYLGLEIPEETIVQILTSLQLEVENKGEYYLVTVPTFRPDITIEVDLIEELVRIYGYEKVPATLPYGQSTQAKRTNKQVLEYKIKQLLTGFGFNELITLSFANKKQYQKLGLNETSSYFNMVELQNPMSEEQSTLRTSLIPGMLEVISRNLSRRTSSMDLFEIGRVFDNQGDQNLPDELMNLCFAVVGSSEIYWHTQPVPKDFYYIKGTLEALFEQLGIKDVRFSIANENPIFHPGRSAKIYIAGVYVGYVGQIHPDVAKNYDIDEDVYLVDLDLEEVFAQATLTKRYKTLPKFPGTERDLAIVVDDNVSAASVMDIIKSNGTELLQSVKLFDVYKGAQIAEGCKSLAISLSFQAEDRTLTDEEINKIFVKIQKQLEGQVKAQLR